MFSALFAGEAGTLLEILPEVAAGLARVRQPLDLPEEAEVFSGPTAVLSAAQAWLEIEAEAGAGTPFQSIALAQTAAAAHLLRGETPHIAIVRQDGRPVVIFPGVVGRFLGLRTLRFLGDPLIQYGDIVATPDARPHHIEAAWEALHRTAGVQAAYLRKVRADAKIRPLLDQQARTVANEQAPFIDLRHADGMNARDARELRRFRRRLAEQGELRFEVVRGPRAIGALREALAMKRRWLAERNLSSSVIGDAQWEAALQTVDLSHPGREHLAVAYLTVGGKAAAIEVGLISRESWHAFLGATAPEFARAGPGHVQMAETLEFCRQQGLLYYDLLAPAQPYKLAMASGSVSVRDYVAPLGLCGRLVVKVAERKRAAQRLFTALPARVRDAARRLSNA